MGRARSYRSALIYRKEEKITAILSHSILAMKEKKTKHREHASYAESHASMPTNEVFPKSTNWIKPPNSEWKLEGKRWKKKKKKRKISFHVKIIGYLPQRHLAFLRGLSLFMHGPLRKPSYVILRSGGDGPLSHISTAGFIGIQISPLQAAQKRVEPRHRD